MPAMKSLTSHRKGCLERLVEKYFPDLYRMLKLMHVEHILHLNGKVRCMLLVSSLISIIFAYVWISDITHGTCFKRTPWTEEGLARYTCIYQSFGSLIFLFMFHLSAVALINYDDQSQDLIKKKRRLFGELRDQTVHALKRAKNMATELVGLLSKEMEFILDQYVLNMREILKSLDANGASALKNDLLIAMATHLHELREPAMHHFSRLIEFSANETLIDMLAKEHMESMVKLLLGLDDEEHAAGLPRTLTLDGAHAYHLPATSNTRCCCLDLAKKPNIFVEKHFAVSSEFVGRMQQEFQVSSKQDHPGKVVLRPVNMVLTWFSDFSSKDADTKLDGGSKNVRKTTRDDLDLECNTKPDANHDEEDDGKSAKGLISNLCESSQGKYMLAGTIFCILYCIFYLVTLRGVFVVLGEGKCEFEEISCIGAAVKKSIGACAMVCYIISMLVVMTKIDKVDHVLIAQRELHEMEDFKHEVDKLNANAFDSQGGGQRVSLMRELHDHLDKKKSVVFDFVRDLRQKSLADYEQFLEEMSGDALSTQIHEERDTRAEK